MTQRAIDGDYIYLVTTNVQNRRWFFVTPDRAATLGHAIQMCCRMKSFDLLAYCILPNHVHLVVRKLSQKELSKLDLGGQPQRTLGSVRYEKDARSQEYKNTFLFPHRRRPRRRSQAARYTLSELMHSIKSTFSHSLKQGKFWQHRSNFRIVETEEYLGNAVEYIRFNYQKMNLDGTFGNPPYVFVDWGQI